MSDGCFFLTRQTDHALQDFGFLRARKSMAAIKQETWDPGYAHLMGNPVFLRYEFAIHVTPKVIEDFVSIFAMGDGNLNQNVKITNVASIKEVSRKQIFNQIIPDSRAFGANFIDHAMGLC
jgi:hypothetical protein